MPLKNVLQCRTSADIATASLTSASLAPLARAHFVYDQMVRRLGTCAAIARAMRSLFLTESAVLSLISKSRASCQRPGTRLAGMALTKLGTKPTVLAMSACAVAAASARATGGNGQRRGGEGQGDQGLGDRVVLVFMGESPFANQA